MIARIFTLLLIMFMVPAVQAEAEVIVYQNGNQLIKDCEGDEPIRGMFCLGFMAGTMDTLEVLSAAAEFPKIACKPKDVTITQLRKIFIQFTSEHPEELHNSASSIMLTALVEAFPCE